MAEQNFNVLANFARAFASSASLEETWQGIVDITLKGSSPEHAYDCAMLMLRELARQELIVGFDSSSNHFVKSSHKLIVCDGGIKAGRSVHFTDSHELSMPKDEAIKIQSDLSFDFRPCF